MSMIKCPVHNFPLVLRTPTNGFYCIACGDSYKENGEKEN